VLDTEHLVEPGKDLYPVKVLVGIRWSYGWCYGNHEVLAYRMLVITEPISLGWIQLKIVPEPKKEVFLGSGDAVLGSN
jgi:hypothetical protein